MNRTVIYLITFLVVLLPVMGYVLFTDNTPVDDVATCLVWLLLIGVLSITMVNFRFLTSR